VAIVTVSHEKILESHNSLMKVYLFELQGFIGGSLTVISCPIFQLHYKYPSAFSLDVASNYWSSTVHAYFDLHLALSRKDFSSPSPVLWRQM